MHKLILAAATLLVAGPGSAEAQTAAPEVNWQSQCVAPDRTSPVNCSMEQVVFVAKSGQQIAKLTITTGAGADAQRRFILQLPLGLSVKDGVDLVIDKKPPMNVDIRTCEASGCYVNDPLSKNLLDGLRRGKELKIVLKNLQSKAFSLPISLNGFSATFDAIK